jgi:predicted peroxiredoxin
MRISIIYRGHGDYDVVEPNMSKVLIKSAWGSDDPTKAAFPFLHAVALAEAGHNVQIFLLGEGVSLMRNCVADAVVPVGWPPLATTLGRVVELSIKIHV